MNCVDRDDMQLACGLTRKRPKVQFHALQDKEHHLLFARHRLLGRSIKPRTNRNDGGEGLGSLLRSRMKYRRDVTIGGVGACIAAVIAPKHIGCERAYALAAAAALRAFFLPGVVVKQILVSGRHHGLNGIGGGGLARAVCAGEQAHGAEIEFTVGDVSPIHE